MPEIKTFKDLKAKPHYFFSSFGLKQEEIDHINKIDAVKYDAKKLRLNASKEELEKYVKIKKKNLDKLETSVRKIMSQTKDEKELDYLENFLTHIEHEKFALEKVLERRGKDKILAFMTAMHIRRGKVDILKEGL